MIETGVVTVDAPGPLVPLVAAYSGEITPAAWLLIKNLNSSGNIYYGAQGEVGQGQGMPLVAGGADLLPPLGGGSLYIYGSQQN
jgi:hypothetical protein